MAIEQALYNLLTSSATIKAIVRPGVIEQTDQLPAIVYSQSSGERLWVMGGSGGMARVDYSLSCLEKSVTNARELAEAVIDLLNGYSGTVSGIVIASIKLNGESDVFSFDAELAENRIYGKDLDIEIWYYE